MEFYSKEAEQKLLGSIIIDESVRLDLATKINVNDFYFEENKQIYNAIYKVENEKGLNVDMTTVAEKLRGEVKNISSKLVSLTKQLATGRNAQSYANIIKEKSIRRKMRKTAQKIGQLAQDGDDIEKDLATAEEMLFSLNNTNDKERSYTDIKSYLIDHLDDLFSGSEDGITGLETPFAKLNEITGGLQGGELSIVAGQSGMGKTTFAMNVANHIAQNHRVGIFSLEMNKKKVTNRTLAELSEVEYQKLKKKIINNKEADVIQDVADLLYQKNNLLINDTAGLTINEIRSDARKMKKKEGIELAVVDYDDLIHGGEGENEALRKQNIARSLRNMAKELDVHVMLLCQINRGYSKRQDKRPKMSDLKGSSGLENAADLIMMIYRHSEFDDNLKYSNYNFKNVAEIIIEKGRETRTGRFFAEFDGKFYKFKETTQTKIDDYMNYSKE